MKFMRKYFLFLLFVAGALASCNKDDVITEPLLPEVVFEDDANALTVKTGSTIRIAPTYRNAEGATFGWRIDGKVVGTDPAYDFTAGAEPATVYVGLDVTTAVGTTSEELRIDVVDRLLPTILLPGAAEGFSLVEGEERTFEPVVDERQPVAYAWTVDGKPASSEKTFTFRRDTEGDYAVALHASNEDGEDRIEFTVRVYSLENMPFGWEFVATEFNTTAGRPMRLAPAHLTHADGAVYAWYVGGEQVQSDDEPGLTFTPAEPGDYALEATMTKNGLTLTQEIAVHAFAAGRFYRPRTASSKAAFDRVYEYTPAPGQFVNDAGAEPIATPEAACDFAKKSLEGGAHVSLGAFGGVIVAGFDHSIDASDGGYDLAVGGNSFDTSSEPGVVWVMQDENGDGLPNDTWYELRGSEWDAPATDRDYAVTYYRPLASASDIPWTDNRGRQGTVPRNEFHLQDSYYPDWVATDSYTLRGTLLENKGEYVYNDLYGSNIWILPPRGWGYADNYADEGREGSWNLFRIADAVAFDGTPAGLDYIDFVKVQSAVQAVCGAIGETSTEVTGLADYALMK